MSDEPPVHALDLQGGGYFSRATCTGCDWAQKGHAGEISRLWDRYHQDGQLVEPLPSRVVIPPLLSHVVVARIEKRIIELLTHYVDFANNQALYVAHGLAEARSFVINQEYTEIEDRVMTYLAPAEYISTIMARIAHLSARQRERLRLPTFTREQQQEIMESR